MTSGSPPTLKVNNSVPSQPWPGSCTKSLSPVTRSVMPVPRSLSLDTGYSFATSEKTSTDRASFLEVLQTRGSR